MLSSHVSTLKNNDYLVELSSSTEYLDYLNGEGSTPLTQLTYILDKKLGDRRFHKKIRDNSDSKSSTLCHFFPALEGLITSCIDSKEDLSVTVKAEVYSVPHQFSLASLMISRLTALFNDIARNGFAKGYTYGPNGQEKRDAAIEWIKMLENRYTKMAKLLLSHVPIKTDTQHPLLSAVSWVVTSAKNQLFYAPQFHAAIIENLTSKPIEEPIVKQAILKAIDHTDHISLPFLWKHAHFSQEEKNNLLVLLAKHFLPNKDHFYICKEFMVPAATMLSFLISSGADMEVQVKEVNKSVYQIFLESLPWFLSNDSYSCSGEDEHCILNTVKILKSSPLQQKVSDDIIFKMIDDLIGATDTFFVWDDERSRKGLRCLIHFAYQIRPALYSSPQYGPALCIRILTTYYLQHHASHFLSSLPLDQISQKDLNALFVAILDRYRQDIRMERKPVNQPWYLPYLNKLQQHGATVFDVDNAKFIDHLCTSGGKYLVTDFKRNPEQNQKILETYMLKTAWLEGEENNAWVNKKWPYDAIKALRLFSPRFVEFFDKYRAVFNESFYERKKRRNISIVQEVEKYPDYLATLYSEPNFALNLSDADLLTLHAKASVNSVWGKMFAKVSGELQSVEIFYGGIAKDTWTKLSSNIIERAPAPRSLPKDEKEEKTPNWRREDASDYFKFLAGKGWEFFSKEKLFGRTMLLHSRTSNQFYAVKIQKVGESEESLSKEYVALTKAHKTDLKSYKPQPIALKKLSGLLTWLQHTLTQEAFTEFTTLAGEVDDERAIYVYKADPRYFMSLADAKSDEEFTYGCFVAISDLYRSLGMATVYPQLLSARPVLANHLDPKSFPSSMYFRPPPYGTGQITGYEAAVKQPSIRVSGLADWGDTCRLEDFYYRGMMTHTFFSTAERQYQEKVGNYTLANILAEYQLTLFLLIAKRGRRLTKEAQDQHLSPEEEKAKIKAIWERLAKQVLVNCALGVAELTHKPVKEIYQQLNSEIDLDRLCRQMIFWLTDAYIIPVQNNAVPFDIFFTPFKLNYGPFELSCDENATHKLAVDFSKFKPGTFDPKIGFSINGKDVDLGAAYGVMPIIEFIKLLYKMVEKVFVRYHLLRLVKEDLTKIKSEINSEKKEALKNSSFEYLHGTRRRFMQLQVDLKNSTDATEAKKIQEKIDLHRAANAVSIWRKAKNSKPKRITALPEVKSLPASSASPTFCERIKSEYRYLKNQLFQRADATEAARRCAERRSSQPDGYYQYLKKQLFRHS